jgi:hypothetical protein
MNKNNNLLTLLCFVFLFVLSSSACEGGNMSHGTVSLAPIKSIPESAWQRLAEKKIYFGHQSVGYNIVEGLEQIKKENPQIKLDIVEIEHASKLSGPVFAHSDIGENEDTHSKIQDFSEYMAKGIGSSADIAFFKFCYVDITRQSDIDKIFAEYKKTMESLNKKYPHIIFIHTTVPLQESKTSVRSIVKTVLGKEDNNVKRNRYNEMLRKEYGGKEPLFDIAQVESTHPDGTRSSFTQSGATYYSMAPEYTDDGGHLNEQGQRAVAQELLILLTKLAQK